MTRLLKTKVEIMSQKIELQIKWLEEEIKEIEQNIKDLKEKLNKKLFEMRQLYLYDDESYGSYDEEEEE